MNTLYTLLGNRASALASHTAANILLHVALLTPPVTLTHSKLAILFLPPIISCHIYSWTCGFGVFAAVHTLWSLDLLLFRHPRERFRLLHRDRHVKATKTKALYGGAVWSEAYPDSFTRRFWWVTKLSMSTRFVGWDTGDQRAMRFIQLHEPETSRTRWLLRRACNALFCFVIIDGTTAFQNSDSYFMGHTDIDSSLPKLITETIGKNLNAFISPRALRLIVFGTQTCAVFSILGTLIALFSVSLGFFHVVDDFWTNPKNWQPVMGNPLVVLQIGLRGFWGKFWHQLFRYILSDPGKYLAGFIHTTAGSTTAYIVEVLMAFFVSGLLHASTLPVDISGIRPLRYAAFFWLHGVATAFEIFLSYAVSSLLGSTLKPLKLLPSMIKLVWICSVFYVTGPLLLDEAVKISSKIGSRPTILFGSMRM